MRVPARPRPRRPLGAGLTGDLLRFGAGLAVVTGATTLLAWRSGAGLGWLPTWAIVRAVAQLTVVALILGNVLGSPWLVVLFLALMLTTASWTALRRLDQLWRGRSAAVLGVTAGSAVAVTAVVGLRLVELEPRYVIAVAGIIVGNAMSAATLAGRNLVRAIATRHDELEAWLSLGATPSQAHRDLGREAVRESLLPGLDQTKSTGLVTLPGAFVGALFGGASPTEAAMFQLAVLAGIALASTITSVVVTRMAGTSPYVAGPGPN